jgi:type VI secretion system secreted protein VgrG
VVGTVLSGNDTGEWTLTCDARSTCFAYRPALRTPRPHVQGVESATVVGPPGSEIHTDEFGRVRVQFHWDRVGDRDDESSCWLPVSQPWAGTGYGSVFLPRVGHEVFVEFLGGDPDRPVVSGRVYTNLQRVPYKLPEQASVTVVAKTNSLGGSGGYNEIKADDKGGAELLSFRAQRDLEGLVLREERRTIGVDRITKVGKDDRLIIAGVETREFTSNKPNAPRTVQTFTNALNKIEVGDASVVCTPTSVTATAPMIKLTTSKDGGAGAEIKLEGETITITAKNLIVTTSEATDIKGTPIRLNCR